MQKPWPPVRPLHQVAIRHQRLVSGAIIADNPDTFRFASTAPLVRGGRPGEGSDQPSLGAVLFGLAWGAPRRVPLKLDDPAKLREVLRYHDDAETFCAQLLSQANAE